MDLVGGKKKYMRKQARLAYLLLSPYVIVFVLFSVVPVFMGIVFSFMKYNPYMPEGSEFVGFQNYLNVFNFNLEISKTFWTSFATMFLFDLVAVPCIIIIPLILAYLINLKPRGYKIFRAIIFLPSILSVTVVGIIYGNMFAGSSSGLVNSWLGTEIPWLSGKPFAGDTLRWFVMLIASIWWQTGTNFVIFSGALRDVPASLYEAGEMDGATRWQKIRFITLPGIKTALTICVFNSLIGYLNLYGQPVVLNEIDNENILVSPMMFIQKYLMGGTIYAKQTGYICACAIVFACVVILFSLLQRKAMAEMKRKAVYSSEYVRIKRCQMVCAQVEKNMQEVSNEKREEQTVD